MRDFEGLKNQPINSPFIAQSDVGGYVLRNHGLRILATTKYKPTAGMTPADAVTGCLFGQGSDAAEDLSKSLSMDIHQAGLSIHLFLEIATLRCKSWEEVMLLLMNMKRLMPLTTYYELCSPIYLMINAIGTINNVKVESFFFEDAKRLFFRGIEWALTQGKTFVIGENNSEIEYECTTYRMCSRSEFGAKAELICLYNPVGLIPSLKKTYFKGIGLMDNNRMCYVHHAIGNTHVNLLVVGSDLEMLQECTLKPTVFETVAVRCGDQSLLMAVPVLPEHVKYKTNLTLVNEECDTTIFRSGAEKYFAITCYSNLLGFSSDYLAIKYNMLEAKETTYSYNSNQESNA